MTSQAQVLQTVELLELILAPLPMRDLIAARLVNFIWNEIISKSNICQRTLYLLPEPDTSEFPPSEALRCSSAGNNPLFLQRFVQQAALHALRKINPTVHFLGIEPFILSSAAAFADPAASWRNMLLFQPPVRLARLEANPRKNLKSFHTVRNSKGVRMGDVAEYFDYLARTSSYHDNSNYVDMLSKTVVGEVYWGVIWRPYDQVPEDIFMNLMESH